MSEYYRTLLFWQYWPGQTVVYVRFDGVTSLSADNSTKQLVETISQNIFNLLMRLAS